MKMLKPFTINKHLTLITVSLATVFALSTQPNANALLLSYEGFTGYPTPPSPNDIVTRNGGSGWGGAWGSPSSDGFLHSVRTPTALSYAGYSGTSTPATSGGNYLNLAAAFGGSNPTSVFRALDTSGTGGYNANGYLSGGLIGADNKTLWASFLYSNNLGVGTSTKTLQLEGGGTFTFTLPQTATTNFLVFRIDFGVGSTDTVTTFSNPNLATFDGTTGGVTSAAGNYSFNTLRFTEQYSNGPGGQGSEGQYDDIRFGTTLADVAPIPEPSTLALLGLGVMALALRKRRASALK